MGELGERESPLRAAFRLFAGDLDPRRMVLAALLFVLAAALLATGVGALQALGGVFWIAAAALAIRGWIRHLRSRRAS